MMNDPFSKSLGATIVNGIVWLSLAVYVVGAFLLPETVLAIHREKAKVIPFRKRS